MKKDEICRNKTNIADPLVPFFFTQCLHTFLCSSTTDQQKQINALTVQNAHKCCSSAFDGRHTDNSTTVALKSPPLLPPLEPQSSQYSCPVAALPELAEYLTTVKK
jgi:hypothetical protein